jgi:hypothetical protein
LTTPAFRPRSFATAIDIAAKGLVDLDALDVCGFPAGAVEHLLRSELAGSLSCVSVILIMRTGGV